MADRSNGSFDLINGTFTVAHILVVLCLYPRQTHCNNGETLIDERVFDFKLHKLYSYFWVGEENYKSKNPTMVFPIR